MVRAHSAEAQAQPVLLGLAGQAPPKLFAEVVRAAEAQAQPVLLGLAQQRHMQVQPVLLELAGQVGKGHTLLGRLLNRSRHGWYRLHSGSTGAAGGTGTAVGTG